MKSAHSLEDISDWNIKSDDLHEEELRIIFSDVFLVYPGFNTYHVEVYTNRLKKRKV